MAGTINLALTQQFDLDDRPLSGGLLYFFQAATTTPQSAFKDIALTLPHPNPIVLLADGRVPMFYLADGNIKIRLTTKTGVTVLAEDNLLVIGPSAGGGGGGASVDPTTVIAVGDIKARFGTGTLTGFVRCNGLTIGNATSGATERANTDCQALFEYLWSTAVLAITPTRGATANADWLAGRQCALPDLRGRAIAGLDDMGATASNRLTAAFFGASGTVLGNAGGAEKRALVAANLARHIHAGTSGNNDATHTHPQQGTFTSGNPSATHTHKAPALSLQINNDMGAGLVGRIANVDYHASNLSNVNSGAPSADHTHNVTLTGNTGNNDVTHKHPFTSDTGYDPLGTPLADPPTAVATATPSMVLTFYIKL
jgi:hypothetical protein